MNSGLRLMIRRFTGLILCLAALLSLGLELPLYSYAADGAEENKIVSSSITLSENIKLDVELRIVSPDAHSISVSAPGGRFYNLKLSDIVENDNIYLLSADIAVKNLAESVVYKVLDEKGNVISEHKTSALEYCERYKTEYPDGVYTELVDSLILFADASKRYFNRALGAGEVLAADFTSVKDIVKSKKQISGITHKHATLILESQTSIRHYFELDAGYDISNYTFFVDLDMNGKYSADMPERLTPVQKGEYYYIEISGISPNELTNMYKIGVTASGGTYTCAYGALNYAKNMYNKNAEDDITRNLCASILAYSNASALFLGETQSLCYIESGNYQDEIEIGSQELTDEISGGQSSKRITIRVDLMYVYSGNPGSLDLILSDGARYELVKLEGLYAYIGDDVSSESSLKLIKGGSEGNKIPVRLEIVLDYDSAEARCYLNGFKIFEGTPAVTFPEWDKLISSAGKLARIEYSSFSFDGIYVYVGNTGK